MKAARLHAYNRPLQIDEIPVPEPGHGQVLVRVLGAGFCHSDLHILDGETQVFPRLPITLGHENAGIVEAVGPGVQRIRPGMPVAVFGGWGCGACEYCVSGEEQLCLTPMWAGLSASDGGYAEYLLVPAERHLIPLGELDPREAAPLTDAALTPYRAIQRARTYITPDHAVLVVGAGGLGQYGIKLLRILGGAPIIAIDTDPTKRELALSLGARHALDGRDPNLSRQIRELSGGGVSAAFDFVGTDATLMTCLAATRSLGKVTQIGLAGGTATITALKNTRFEVAFEATFWGTIKELREVVALAESGLLAPIDLDYIPLDAIGDVPERLRRGEFRGRAVITP